MSDNHYFMLDDEAFAYINMGTNAAPSWSLMNNAEEFMIDLSKVEIELPFAGSGFKLTRGGKFEAPVSFKYSRPKASITDAIHQKLFDSFVLKKPVQFAWTDQIITEPTARGIKVWAEVMKYPLKKNIEEAQTLDIEALPTDYVEAGLLILPALIGSTPP